MTPMHQRNALRGIVIGLSIFGSLVSTYVPPARAVPAPEVEYMYNVAVRRHYGFPDNDAIGYGYQICEKIVGGADYPQVMGDVKSDVVPNDEASANFLVSNAVGILCPSRIWWLRKSAAHYQPRPQ